MFDRDMTIACVVYTIAASSEYWLLSWLNFIYGIKLPILTAIVQNASWPLQGVVYGRERREHERRAGPRVISAGMYRSYCLLGCLNAVITLTRTIGLTTLPPTVHYSTIDRCIHACSAVCVWGILLQL